MSRLKAEYKRLKKLVKRNPILYVRLADIELQMGKAREARNRLINGLESDAENSTAYLLLAQAQGRLKDAEGSLKSYEEVLRLDPLNLRARKAYVELLHLLGRTDLEYAAHTRLYELSPSDTETEQKQKDLVHWTMKQLFGDDFEWQDDWHPGDITEIGGLSTVVSKELELMPERAPLPKQFTPDVDDSLVTQMIARLPSTDDDEQVEEFKLPGQKKAEESSNGKGNKDETDAAETDAAAEDEDKDYDPDSNLIQHTEPVEPKPSAPETEDETDSAAESVDDAASDQDAVEAPAVEMEPETVTEETQSTPPEAETTKKPATVDGEERNPNIIYEDEEEQEVGVEAMLAQLMSEGSGDDNEETEPEHIPTPLENAVKLGGQPLDHVVDFKQVLNELKEDDLVLVEDPDLEATIPEIHEPAKPEATDESESEQAGDDSATAGDDVESDVEAAPKSEAEAPVEPVTETEPPKAASEEPKPEPEPEKQSSGTLNQSDLDALLSQFKSGQAKPESSTTGSEETNDTPSEPDSEPAPEAVTDAVPTAEESEAASAPEPAAEKEEPAAPSGPMNQSDLDALMASFKAGSSKPESSAEAAAEDAKPEPVEEPESSEEPAQATAEETEPETVEPEIPAAPSGPLDQNSLDELMAAFKAGSKTPKKSTEPEPAAEADAPSEEQPVAEELAKDEPVAAEPDAELTAQTDDVAPDEPVAETPSEPDQEPEKPAASAAQERPAMPEASIPKKPASQEDLDDLISQFTSKRRGKPGSQKPVEIGKYASKPQAEEDADDAKKSAGETAEPVADTTADDNITEGLKQPEENVPSLTEEELARRASYAMTPSRVEDEVESLEDQPEAEDETTDLSELDTPHDDEFEPYGLSKSGNAPDAQPADVDNETDSESAPEPETAPAPEQPETSEPEAPKPEATTPEKPQPEPETPSVTEPQPEPTPEPEPTAQAEPDVETEPTPATEQASTPAPEERPEPAPAPPPAAAQAKPKPKPEPAGIAPRPKRTPPPPPKRDETAPEEYRGPVSKTLIRLQIGQGKYDHARAMLNRLRQQSPADPDLEKLAEQIEAAIS